MIYDSTWFDQKALSHSGYFVERYNEIPRTIYQASPNTNSFEAFHLEKTLPSKLNTLLYKEKGLLSREVSFISQRLSSATKVNVFDLYDATFEGSAMPFILELIEDEQLGKYIPVTPCVVMNDYAIKKMEAAIINYDLPPSSSDSILIDVEYDDFRSHIRTVISNDDGTIDQGQVNLFIIMSSNLGNFIDPSVALKNIFNSMGTGDYLAILQGIYKAGSEDALVRDYSNIAYTMEDTMHVSNTLSGGEGVKVIWDEIDRAVKFKIKLDRPMSMGKVELDQGREITTFRTSRYQDNELRKTFMDIGYKIVDTAYDESMNNGLYFLEK